MKTLHEMEIELINSMPHTTTEEILAVVDAISELRRKYKNYAEVIIISEVDIEKCNRSIETLNDFLEDAIKDGDQWLISLQTKRIDECKKELQYVINRKMQIEESGIDTKWSVVFDKYYDECAGKYEDDYVWYYNGEPENTEFEVY